MLATAAAIIGWTAPTLFIETEAAAQASADGEIQVESALIQSIIDDLNKQAAASKADAELSEIYSAADEEHIIDITEIYVNPNDITDAAGVMDLTNLNSLMLFAQIYEMIYNGTQYDGKTVRIQGIYNEFDYSTEYGDYDQIDKFVVIPDALACCETGMLLKWETEPQEMPNIGDVIEIVGTYNHGIDGYWVYYHIDVDSMTVIN